MMRIRTYTELIQIPEFEDRYEYLKLGGGVGVITLGFDRYVGQAFYTSAEWRNLRRMVILRDEGRDLGCTGYDINGELLVHHINPLDADDIRNREDWILNPEFLITTTHITHNAIHYGDRSLLPKPFVERTRGDTKLW